jgi:hypothetical protein
MRIGLSLRHRLTGGRERLLELAQLVLQVGERPGRVGILELDRRRPPLQLPRVEQRRKRLGHVVEDPLPPFVARLDLLPVLPNASGRSRLDIAEHVRVPPYELLVDPAGSLLQIAVPLLLEQEREEIDLEEQVAKLVEQLLGPVRKRRVGDLVRLLDGVRHDRPRRLLPVPGTVPPQALGQLLEIEERARE